MWTLILSTLTSVFNLNKILSGIPTLFNAIISNIIKYWKFYLPVFLVALQFLTAHGWYTDHNALKSEKIAHQIDASTYRKAQADAQAAAIIEKTKLQQESKVKADAADQNYSVLLTQYRANLLRYSTSKSGSLKSSNSQPGDTSQSSDGSGTGSNIPTTVGNINITQSDAQICAVNTARLVAVHDWAIQLKDKPDAP